MKSFLTLVVLQVAVAGHGVLGIWRCTRPGAEGLNPEVRCRHPSTDEDIDYSEDHATPRPTMYWCAPNATQTYITTIVNPAAAPKVFELPATPIGIVNISNTNNLQEDEGDLRRELRHQFEWKRVQVPYLGKSKNETKKATLAAKTGAIFFQSFATCHKQLSHESGAYDEGLAPAFVVATEPFQFELPKLGSCTPKDQYLPIRNAPVDLDPFEAEDAEDPNAMKDEDLEFLFTNQKDQPVEQEMNLQNFGFMWTLKAYHHLQAPRIQRLFAGPDPIISVNDALIASIRKDIIRVFTGIKQSPITGLSWSTKFFGDDNGREFPLVSTNYTRELTRTLPPKSVVRFFQLVGECGEYTVYTNQIYSRVYDISGKKCVGPEKGSRPRSPEGIKKCNFCTRLECADETKFLDKIEYAT